MEDWLFPDRRPMWDKSHPEMPFADCNWAPNESKEDEIMTKTAAKNTKTAATEKETPMTEQTANKTANNEKETTVKYNYREDKARHEEIRANAKLGRTKAVEVTSCIPGHTTDNFTDDPAEVELLGKAAAKFGMGTEFCTVSQAKKFGGTLDPEYKGHGWLVKYLPYTPKSGKNAGVTTQFSTVVYPKAAFVWAAGEPVKDEQLEAERAARKAKSAARAANKALKDANKKAGIKTPRRKTTSHKPATKKVEAAPNADVAALTESLNAVMAQNAQLIAALTATLSKKE